MSATRTITIGVISLLISAQCLAAANQPAPSPSTPSVPPAPQAQTLTATAAPQSADLAQIQTLKQQLFTDLSAGDIQSGKFDENSEVEIANVQMQLANKYLSIGDRKNAAIYALSARKTLQTIYTNPNDPRLIPVYSLLVDIYETDVDNDYPGTDVSDAAQAKLYRSLIDHIHAE